VRSGVQPPTESLPIGARVPTKNPNRFEVDPQPEPDQAIWAKLSITVERSDGGIVDAEIIRPRSWILRNGICACRMLPFNLPELEVSGLALVTAIDDCPPIAGGEGSVVTARFVTREVHIVASVDVLGADGTVETITGTTIHPVWSVDRQEWVPLSELSEDETLQGLNGLAVVLSVSLSRISQPVYNIEVHGEHVYQVGELGLVVHNSCPIWTSAKGKTGIQNAYHHFTKHRNEFPEIQNSLQYVKAAREIANNPSSSVLSKVRARNGDRLFYNVNTNTFVSQRVDGALRTMFRPSDGLGYWNLQ
jgi:hypothetical protein